MGRGAWAIAEAAPTVTQIKIAQRRRWRVRNSLFISGIFLQVLKKCLGANGQIVRDRVDSWPEEAAIPPLFGFAFVDFAHFNCVNFPLGSWDTVRLPKLSLLELPLPMTAADLLQMPYPAEFTAGAQSAVTTCLRIDPAEKVTLITDRAT